MGHHPKSIIVLEITSEISTITTGYLENVHSSLSCIFNEWINRDQLYNCYRFIMGLLWVYWCLLTTCDSWDAHPRIWNPLRMEDDMWPLWGFSEPKSWHSDPNRPGCLPSIDVRMSFFKDLFSTSQWQAPEGPVRPASQRINVGTASNKLDACSPWPPASHASTARV